MNLKAELKGSLRSIRIDDDVDPFLVYQQANISKGALLDLIVDEAISCIKKRIDEVMPEEKYYPEVTEPNLLSITISRNRGVKECKKSLQGLFEKEGK